MNRRFLPLFFITVLLCACSDDEVGKRLTAYDEQVIQYFQEIALGFEYGGATEVTRKWVTDMKIFVGGNKTPELMNELQAIINEINSLANDGFKISIVTDTLQSNYYVFLGAGATYAERFPSLATLVADNWGLFSVYWDATEQIYRGHMYVDIERANPAEEKHLLREELTQSLGLAKDSNSDLYLNSIFQAKWTTTTAYDEIDKDLIRLLYHPDMQIGLNREQVEELLREVLLSEK
ncbi:DUF2927 domain-containing protein [Chryseolinea sp. H1M3-3]|uniref:DUF2927 domain-containing protein n=1 Tax=Chryseolinea sp. H1M3-3 TaxID=3034144 RepID=UPI0023EB638F|nr:DUF2927 domain-containing protein [Chryseolinea sp. H1M3-3]